MAVRAQPGLKLRHEAVFGGQAVASGQAVAQRHDGDGFGKGRTCQCTREGEVAEAAERAISVGDQKR